MLGLGLACLIRFVPELAMTESWPALYLTYIGLDFAGGALAIAGGIGLMKPRRWGWAVTMAAWGALSMNAGFVLTRMFDGVGEGCFLFLPRLLFFPLVLLMAPYGLWAVLIKPNEERGPRLLLILWFTIGTAFVGIGLWWALPPPL